MFFTIFLIKIFSVGTSPYWEAGVGSEEVGRYGKTVDIKASCSCDAISTGSAVCAGVAGVSGSVVLDRVFCCPAAALGP